MDLATALRQIWRYKLWLVPITVVAVIGGLATTHKVTIFPPGIHTQESLEYGVADAELLVDSDTSSLAQLETPVEAIAQRAALYSQLLKTQPVKQMIAKRVGLPPQLIQVSGQAAAQGSGVPEPPAALRTSEILDNGAALTLYFMTVPGSPIVNLYAQAPTSQGALKLVKAGITSLQDYADGLQAERRVPRWQRVRFEELGRPDWGNAVAGADEAIFSMVSVVIFLAGCFLLLIMPPFLQSLKRAPGTAGGSQGPWDYDRDLELVPLEPVEFLDPVRDEANGSDAAAGQSPGARRR